MAKGYSQEYVIDYKETFALVAHMMFVRSLSAVTTAKQQLFLQMKVKTTFDHDMLFEEVYMKYKP